MEIDSSNDREGPARRLIDRSGELDSVRAIDDSIIAPFAQPWIETGAGSCHAGTLTLEPVALIDPTTKVAS